MSTALGPGVANWRFTGINTGAATISRGLAVALEDTAFAGTKYLPDSIQEDAIPIEIAGTNTQVLGVAAYDIEVGKLGEFVVVGLAWVLSGGPITAGNALEILAASGKFDDSGGILTNQEFGIAMEAATGADELIRAWVNFLAYDGSLSAP